MTRSRASARAAGTRFERTIADHLAAHVDDRIDRRVKTGSKDRGDIAGVRTFRNRRVVIECKDVTRIALAQWIDEAHTQAGNDDADVGIVVHKRHGIGAPGQQWVTMTVDDLVVLLNGYRPDMLEP